MTKTPLPAATTTTPTTAQRKMFAKMGLAMPDGSFYIRNGPMGATDLDNAVRAVGRGEADGGNGNDIRRHIMKRAAALKLQDKIPDTWNSDGSLKHDWTDEVEQYLAHFGVKGMHWGVRHSKEELEAKASQHENISRAHAEAAKSLEKDHQDLMKNGYNSAAFKRVYGNDAPMQSDQKFYLRNGQTKGQALDLTSNNLRIAHNSYARSSNRHAAKAAKLRAKAATMSHGDFDDGEFFDSPEEAADILEHFGVKGMRWQSTAQRQAALATQTAQGQKGVQAAKAANANKKASKQQLHLLHLAHLLRLSKASHAAHLAHVAHLKATGQHSQIPAAVSAHQKQQAALTKLASNASDLARGVGTPSAAHSAFDDPDFLEHVSLIELESFDVGDSLEHHGVKGQKWGVRRARKESSDHPVSADAERARRTHETIQEHGLGAVSNEDLQHLVSRQNLERQHGALNQEHVSGGKKFATDFVTQFGKQQANHLATKAVTEGLKRLAKAHASNVRNAPLRVVSVS